MKKILVAILCLGFMQAANAEIKHNLEIGFMKGAAITYSVGSKGDNDFSYASFGAASVGIGHELVIDSDKNFTLGANLVYGVLPATDTFGVGTFGINWYPDGFDSGGLYLSLGAGYVFHDDDDGAPDTSTERGDVRATLAFGYRF